MSKNPDPELYRSAVYLLGVVSSALVALVIWIVNGFKATLREIARNTQKNTVDLEVLERDVKLLRDDHNNNHNKKRSKK